MFRRLWTRWCWFCLPQPGNLGNICYSELFSSSIFMCSDSQRYVPARSLALPFSFFAFCYFFRALFSLLVTAAFLSPVSCLFPETNTSSSSLMKAVFCIENGLAKKKQKNGITWKQQTSKQTEPRFFFVVVICRMLCLFWRECAV